MIGHIQKIDCARGTIMYTVRSGDRVFGLTSKDFQGLSVNTFDGAASGVDIGCGENIAALNAVITFSTAAGQKGGSRGELQSVEFVPEEFSVRHEMEKPVGNEVPATDPDEAQRQGDDPGH